MAEITNNEMTNVNEEVVENVIPEVVEKLSFKDKHPVLYTSAVAALFGATYMAGVYAADSVIRWGKKKAENFKEKRAAKKAEKAKVVEASEVVVEEEA